MEGWQLGQGGDHSPLFCPRGPIWSTVSRVGAPSTRGVWLLELDQRKATEMLRGLEYLCYEEKLQGARLVKSGAEKAPGMQNLG